MKIITEPSEDFQRLLTGIDVECDLQVPEEEPAWLDEELYQKGQEHYYNNLGGIYASNYRNLVVGMCIPNLWYMHVVLFFRNLPYAIR